MDRRLPPSFRSSATDASPSRERSSINDRLHHQRSHNRPWGSGADSPGRYSSLRSVSAVSASAPARNPTHISHSGTAASSPRASSPFNGMDTSFGSGSNRSLSHSSARTGVGTASGYNGMDTTTTIDGSRGSVAAGLSSYERYKSLRLQAAGGSNNSITANSMTVDSSSSSMDIHARASNYLNSSKISSTPSSPIASTPKTISTKASSPSTGVASQLFQSSNLISTSSPSSSSNARTAAATRSSSPRDLRKQRLQQQYSVSGRTSPFRQPAEPSHRPSERSSPFRPPPSSTTMDTNHQTQQSSASVPVSPLFRSSTTATSSSSPRTDPSDKQNYSNDEQPVAPSSKEKKSRKSKKSSSRNNKMSGDEGSDDNAAEIPSIIKKSGGRKSVRTASLSHVVHSEDSDDEGGAGSGKKKKKSSKHSKSHRRSKRSSAAESSGDELSGDGIDGNDVEPPGPLSARGMGSSRPVALDDMSMKTAMSEMPQSIRTVSKYSHSDHAATSNITMPPPAPSKPVPSAKLLHENSPVASTPPSPKLQVEIPPTSPKFVSPRLASPRVMSTNVGHESLADSQSRLATLQKKSSLESKQRDSPSPTPGPPPVVESQKIPRAPSSPFSAASRLRSLAGSSKSGPTATAGTAETGISSSTASPGVTPKDEKPSTTNPAVRGWSTYRNRTRGGGDRSTSFSNNNTSNNPFMSQSAGGESRVSQYLNMRKSITGAFSSSTSHPTPAAAKIAPTPPTTPSQPATTSASTAIPENESVLVSKTPTATTTATPSETDTVTTSSFFSSSTQQQSMFGGVISEGTTDEDEDEQDYEESSSSSDDDEEEGEMGEWSVRVCVVSAVDLPANVVPTVPFSPVLKVGLIRLTNPKTQADASNPEASSKLDSKAKGEPNEIPTDLKNAIHASGLTTVSKARVRSTGAKVMSKRDNGSVEFHEEMRWDANQSPEQMAVAIELSARAVIAPSNHKESPFEQAVKALDFPGGSGRHSLSKDTSAGSSDAGDKSGRLKGLFRRGEKQRSEMDVAKAAAVVAKHLVDGEEGKGEDEESGHPQDSRPPSGRNSITATNNPSSSEMNVKLLKKRRLNKPRLTEDIRLGSQIIPLSKLSWRKALKNNEPARIEQWFELETAAGGSPGKSAPKSSRNPSVLLEISFSSPEVLDESEDDIEEDNEEKPARELKKAASFSRRASKSIRAQLRKEVQMGVVKHKEEEPVLEPGVIDYICVVGPQNIGDQKSDDGASGWVNTSPDSGVLEQFPPTAEYHAANGRNVALPDKVEWFCFPEGCRLWRGTTPPNAEELNLVRFSASSPANIATTIASFDASLGCTTSFSWFVLASNSDEYGSANMKTHGACIRFYVPAPTGIDPTQDDFGQAVRGAGLHDKAIKRLWVPIALCITSQLPIVGAMEMMLLRLCEGLSSLTGTEDKVEGMGRIFHDVASLVINFQRPIPGVVSCSLSFLNGDGMNISLPPTSGLPSLPHGASITSVCRLLQGKNCVVEAGVCWFWSSYKCLFGTNPANGINYILAAMLTECKILIHSDDIANLCLVAEVMTALMYPFQWSLPYIPVLPVPMMEFIEAPLSYLLGIPSSSMRLVSPECLEDVVVIDLDNDFSGVSGHVDEIGRERNTKTPTPLPAATALNIQKAVYRLLQHNDENDDDDGASVLSFQHSRSSPRMEPETQVEREFRIAIALEIASLVRGYQDCLVIGPASQPMFNVDKFLQSAPILFDEQRGSSLTSSSGLRVLSPRSRRFISILVTCQHFHQFLEVVDSDSLSFFREVMTELEAYGSKRDLLAVKRVLSLDAQKTIDQLNSILKRVEDKVPLYKVKKSGGEIELSDDAAKSAALDFPYSLLCPIVMGDEKEETPQSERAEGVNQISLEYLVELEKNPWRYHSFLPIDLGTTKETGFVAVAEKVKLRDAIGERRYNLWKNAVREGVEDPSMMSDELSINQTLDLTSLLADNGDDGVAADNTSSATGEHHTDTAKRRIADAKDRDSLRRCLEQARVAGGCAGESSADTGRDLVSEAEMGLRNESARRFLLAILQKRGSDNSADSQRSRRRASSSGASKLEAGAFEVLLRLGCAMLDACIEDRDYDSAYSLLKLTAGLYSTVEVEDAGSPSVLHMTQRLGHHPIYADLGVWLRAKKMHLSTTKESEGNDDGTVDDSESDEYEAAVATLYEMLGYGIPAEELARFASRVSEENGWFRSERGQSLLLLARRICMRRDTGSANSSQRTTSDIEMMSPTSAHRIRENDTTGGDERGISPLNSSAEDLAESWSEIGWVHPSAQYSSRFEKDVKRRSVGRNEVRNRHMKRSAVTSMAYLGSSVVVTGALDGGVFMARNAKGSPDSEDDDGVGVKGIHLDWGSAGSRYSAQSPSNATDGAYGVGAVSILAATQPANQSYDALQMKPGPSRKSVTDQLDEEELLNAMEGCRVVAGTTCGDLRVWSVKDVLSAVFYALRGNEIGNIGLGDERSGHRGGEGVSSSVIGGRRKSGVDFAAGSSLTRLKFSLRGRALSGHRGGVSCVDVPSHVYRPDSIISGGADGLIKLWSLRAPGSIGRRAEAEAPGRGPMNTPEDLSSRTKATRSGDAMSILAGHGGRVLCVKTAWHGDRLLSGGADRTVRLWDLGGSGGKCLNSLSGHFGWVTSVKYWGPNTIISASTDRSIALWDARVRNAPLFALRHHYAPISDILVGARTDPIMISAGGDGTIAAWDFRRLSDEASQSPSSQDRKCKVIRRPAGKLYLHDFSSRRRTFGPVMLSRGPSSRTKTVCCLGRDSIIREWDIRNGDVVSEHVTGHCDTVSTFASLDGDKPQDSQIETSGKNSVDGTITTSWDGTVRVRRLDKS